MSCMDGMALVVGSAAGSGEAALPPPPPPLFGSENNLASSVTRQVVISGPGEWELLLVGIDTLDVNLHVEWVEGRESLFEALAKGKVAAENTQGILWGYRGVSEVLIAPAGKRRYKYHLIHPFGHIFISTSQKKNPEGNVFISPLSRALWQQRIVPTLQAFVDLLAVLGGRVNRVQISRCDLMADFRIPGGLSFDFLDHYRVSRSRKFRIQKDDDTLETFYAGDNGAPLLLRIYDKAAEVKAHPEKLFFFDLWKQPEDAEVWRFEFQLSRQVLREFGVDSLEDLEQRSGGIWAQLTSDWFSLRAHDDENQTRRSFLLFWQAVQSAGGFFGSEIPCKRRRDVRPTIDTTRHVAQAAGLLMGFAARKGLSDLGNAAGEYLDAILEVMKSKDFDSAYRVRRIQLGMKDETGESHE